MQNSTLILYTIYCHCLSVVGLSLLYDGFSTIESKQHWQRYRNMFLYYHAGSKADTQLTIVCTVIGRPRLAVIIHTKEAHSVLFVAG